MKKPILIGAALLLATTAIGAAIAAGSIDLSGRHAESRYGKDHGEDGRVRLAGEMRERHHDRHHKRHARNDDDEDDDDDEGEGGGRGSVPQNGPADPNAPVPDNGLFQGKARPKVEVQ